MLKAIPNFIYLLIALGLGALFILFSTQCYFADSEIWLLTQSQRIFDIGGLISIYYKFSFHALIYLFSHWAPTELGVYLWARVGCALLALGTCSFTAFSFSRVFQRKDLLFPAFIFLLTSSLYFNQSFRIRADAVSAFFHTLIVWTMVRNLSRQVSLIDHMLLFILNLLLISSGPKIIYFFAAQFILGWEMSRHAQFSKKYFWWVWLGHLLCVAVACLAGFITYFIPSLPNVPVALQSAFDFFIYKFDVTQMAPGFFSKRSFAYVTGFFQRSWLHGAFLALSTVWMVFHLVRGKSSPRKAMGVYSLLLFLMALLHNDKLPFFLAFMFMPFIAQSFFVAFTTLSQWRRGQQVAMTLCLALVIYQALGWYNFHLKYNTNLQQKKAIRTLEKYTQAHPGVKIYDVIGILPRKTAVLGFIGPGEEAYKKIIVDHVRAQQPDIILTTFKSDFLQPELRNMFKEGWVQIESGVWTKGQFLSVVETPHIFNRLRTIGQQTYWVMPTLPYRYIYASKPPIPLESEILHLNSRLESVSPPSEYIAIPQQYISLIASDLPPPGLFLSPHKLFRFDTGF